MYTVYIDKSVKGAGVYIYMNDSTMTWTPYAYSTMNHLTGNSVDLIPLASMAAFEPHWMNNDKQILGKWGTLGHNIEHRDRDGSKYLVMMCDTGMRGVLPPFRRLPTEAHNPILILVTLFLLLASVVQRLHLAVIGTEVCNHLLISFTQLPSAHIALIISRVTHVKLLWGEDGMMNTAKHLRPV